MGSGRRRRKRYGALLLLAGGCALFLLLLYAGGNWLEKSSRQPETRSDHTMRYAYEPSIEVDGKRYRRRDHLTTILLMGVDRDSDTVSTGFRNGGQADFLRLVVIDGGQKVISQIQIDRDTMTPITIIGVTGKMAGMRNAQISLSHGFGDGKAQSCELTVQAVSNLLMNADIDFYMALNMDGVSVLNDWVGGVPVTLTQDLTSIAPHVVQGATVTLMGDQAEAFVRSRMTVGDGTNASRMERQQDYVSAFTDRLEQKIAGDQNQLQSLLEAVDGYLLTDMARGRIINEFWAAREYEHKPLIKPEGVHRIGSDGFMEFEADANHIQQIIMDLYYEELK